MIQQNANSRAVRCVKYFLVIIEKMLLLWYGLVRVKFNVGIRLDIFFSEIHCRNSLGYFLKKIMSYN